MNATVIRTAWRWGGPILVPLAAVAAWWGLSANSTSLFFPPLTDMLTAFRHNWLEGDTFSTMALPSLVRAGEGLVIAVAAGIALGIVIGLSSLAEALTKPQLEFMRALPPILVIPPLILVLGTGDVMKVGVIAASAVWPILLAAIDGVRSVEPVRDDMIRVFGLPWHARLRYLILPTAIPHIWAGVRAAVPIALVVMVGAEYYSSQNGIGYFISETSTTFRLADMWSAVLLLGLLGMAINGIVLALGRLLDRRYGEFAR